MEAKRPATNRSVQWLHNQIEQQGGTGHFTSLIEYGWDDLLKIFFDIDIKSVTAPNVPALKRQIIQELLQPFFRFVYAKTGVTVDMGNVACSDDTRKTDEGYKFSMHIFINNVVCSAQSLKHLHSILDLPEWVDVKHPRQHEVAKIARSVQDRQQHLHEALRLWPTRVHYSTTHG